MSRTATVTVPATSANLGPGYDSLGLALELRDYVTATLTDQLGVRVSVEGQGAGLLPTDETHLVAKTIIDACATFGLEVTGLDISCQNAIPQGRGLGSSAAAIVAGLVLARELADAPATEDDLLQMANAIEGHPDNVAACLLGAMTIAWVDSDGLANAVSMNVHPDIFPLAAVPNVELSTKKARGLIPAQVPQVDAAFNVARSALLVASMIGDPTFLLEATDDRLHQTYRTEAYPESMALVHALREQGIAACISGAGPSVLALCTAVDAQQAMETVSTHGFTAIPVPVADQGAVLVPQKAV
jgi:homoserine kinase